VLLLFDGFDGLFSGGLTFRELRGSQVDLTDSAPGDEDSGQKQYGREQNAGDDDAMPLGSYTNFFVLHHDDSFIKIFSRESPIDAMARERDCGQSRDVGGEKKQKPPQRGETKMKKLIAITMLSAVAMLAAPAAPKAQNTTAPAATATTKKTTKKHVKKVKPAVKPAAAPTATPSK
jgi:hypothetical protein